MQLFFIKLWKAAAIPLCLLLLATIAYIRKDPYMDLHKYPNYSWKYNFQILGDIATKKLLVSKAHYNTFILGSSRSVSLYACYVQKKISNARVFHYGNFVETIGGIYEKMRLLDERGYSIKNIIIYLDTDNTFKDDAIKCRTGDHYLLTHTSEFSAVIQHFKDFFSDLQNLKILLLGLPINEDSYPNWTSDTITNDPKHTCTAAVLEAYGKTNFSKADLEKAETLQKAGILYQRSAIQGYKENQINAQELALIDKIVQIANKHKAKLYVLITPVYDQLKFSKYDQALLNAHFGAKNVYDFSGINVFTNDKLNYPDGKHFIEKVSKEMIDQVLP